MHSQYLTNDMPLMDIKLIYFVIYCYIDTYDLLLGESNYVFRGKKCVIHGTVSHVSLCHGFHVSGFTEVKIDKKCLLQCPFG